MKEGMSTPSQVEDSHGTTERQRQVLAYVQASPEPVGPTRIAADLYDSPASQGNVSCILGRLHDKGLVGRTPRGQYFDAARAVPDAPMVAGIFGAMRRRSKTVFCFSEKMVHAVNDVGRAAWQLRKALSAFHSVRHVVRPSKYDKRALQRVEQLTDKLQEIEHELCKLTALDPVSYELLSIEEDNEAELDTIRRANAARSERRRKENRKAEQDDEATSEETGRGAADGAPREASHATPV